MIEKNTLARPYAKAIFEVAKQTRDFAFWSLVLKTLTEIAKHESVKRLLRDVSLPPEKMYEFFSEVSEKVLNSEAKNLIHLLALRRRLSLLPEITALFETFRENAEKVLRVEYFSAVPLTAEQQEKITQTLTQRFKQTLLLDWRVDPNLIGGYVIKTGDKVQDNSIKGYLDQMKETMGSTNGY